MNIIATSKIQTPNGAAETIRALAKKYDVHYAETVADCLGRQITRLSDDLVELDEVELILLALERAGHIGGLEATRLHAAYLRNSSR